MTSVPGAQRAVRRRAAELMRLAELVGSHGLLVIEDRLTKPISKLVEDIRVRARAQDRDAHNGRQRRGGARLLVARAHRRT